MTTVYGETMLMRSFELSTVLLLTSRTFLCVFVRIFP